MDTLFVVTCDHVDEGNSVLAVCTTVGKAETIVHESMKASCEWPPANVQDWFDTQRSYEGQFGSFWFIEAVSVLDQHLDKPLDTGA